MASSVFSGVSANILYVVRGDGSAILSSSTGWAMDNSTGVSADYRHAAFSTFTIIGDCVVARTGANNSHSPLFSTNDGRFDDGVLRQILETYFTSA